MPADGKRVELVDERDRSPGLPSYIGLGLLASLVVGFGPLRDAAQGHGSFEDAMTRYLACLLVCLIGASAVGRILDSAPPPVAEDEEPNGDTAESATAESEEGVTT